MLGKVSVGGGALAVADPFGAAGKEQPNIRARSINATISPGKGSRQPVAYLCQPTNSPAVNVRIIASLCACSAGSIHAKPCPKNSVQNAG